MKAKTIVSRMFIFVLIALVTLSLSGCAAQVSAGVPEEALADRLLEFVTYLGILVPVVAAGAPAVSLIVDFAKRLGMNSKYSPALSSALNIALFVAAFFLGPERQGAFDNALSAFYTVSPYVFSLIVSLITTVQWHTVLANAGIGYRATTEDKVGQRFALVEIANKKV